MSAQVVSLFTEAELRDRIGKKTLDRVLDDDDTGVAVTSAIARVVEDASGTVWAYLPNDTQSTIKADDVPSYIKKLALDVAQGTLYVRHPEFQREDGHEMLKQAHKELERLSKQETKVKEVPRPDMLGAVVSSRRADRGWIR